jgi:hypothetical protein
MPCAIGLARRRGCALVQRISDERRDAVHGLLWQAQFVASHEGFELRLTGSCSQAKLTEANPGAGRSRSHAAAFTSATRGRTHQVNPRDWRFG